MRGPRLPESGGSRETQEGYGTSPVLELARAALCPVPIPVCWISRAESEKVEIYV